MIWLLAHRFDSGHSLAPGNGCRTMTTPVPPPDPGGESLQSRVDAKSPPILGGGKGVVGAPFPKAYLAALAAAVRMTRCDLRHVQGERRSGRTGQVHPFYRRGGVRGGLRRTKSIADLRLQVGRKGSTE
jgi:hypothetical protein